MNDAERFEALEAAADERGCGWTLDESGAPVMKPVTENPDFLFLSEAVDAMIELCQR